MCLWHWSGELRTTVHARARAGVVRRAEADLEWHEDEEGISLSVDTVSEEGLTVVAAGGAGRTRRWRRYAALGAVAVGLILVGTTGAAFLATNGTASATVSPVGGTSAGNVYTTKLPTTGTTPPATWVESGSTSAQAPAWNATQGQVTQVSTAGDLAIVDASTPTLITVALTNAAAMASAYTYLNLPIEIYKCATATTNCTWATSPGTTDNPQATLPEYLSFSNASLTFQVTGGSGDYYEVVVPTGGSMYVYSTSGTLAANFLVTSQIL